MSLAAFLAQAHPEPPALAVKIFDLHGQGVADAREAVDHQADQRAIAQTSIRAELIQQLSVPSLQVVPLIAVE